MERDLTLCGGCTMQCADNLLLSCTLETYMVLLTIITPINPIKYKKNKRRDGEEAGMRRLTLLLTFGDQCHQHYGRPESCPSFLLVAQLPGQGPRAKGQGPGEGAEDSSSSSFSN